MLSAFFTKPGRIPVRVSIARNDVGVCVEVERAGCIYFADPLGNRFDCPTPLSPYEARFTFIRECKTLLKAGWEYVDQQSEGMLDTRVTPQSLDYLTSILEGWGNQLKKKLTHPEPTGEVQDFQDSGAASAPLKETIRTSDWRKLQAGKS
jgi:hypothetical protein